MEALPEGGLELRLRTMKNWTFIAASLDYIAYIMITSAVMAFIQLLPHLHRIINNRGVECIEYGLCDASVCYKRAMYRRDMACELSALKEAGGGEVQEGLYLCTAGVQVLNCVYHTDTCPWCTAWRRRRA